MRRMRIRLACPTLWRSRRREMTPRWTGEFAEMDGRIRRDAHTHTLAQALKYLFTLSDSSLSKFLITPA